LGLAICSQLVQQMGGKITVTSDKGAGAMFAFTVTLPHASKATGEPASGSNTLPTEQSTPVTTQDLRILLADDNPVNQQVALMMLERLGYSADIAQNGIEAVDAAVSKDYDVIFMDLQMPEMDGLEATRFIRDHREIRQPCIIALTANAMAEDKQRCVKAGMDFFVAKPMRMNDLDLALQRAITH
jgi:CheY-like chemotaxis protein